MKLAQKAGLTEEEIVPSPTPFGLSLSKPAGVAVLALRQAQCERTWFVLARKIQLFE